MPFNLWDKLSISDWEKQCPANGILEIIYYWHIVSNLGWTNIDAMEEITEGEQVPV